MTILWFQYFQLLSLLCALICRRGLSIYSIGIMIPILVLDNLTEFVGVNFRLFHWPNNYFVYNCYLLLSTPLFLYLFFILLNGSASSRDNSNLSSRQKTIYWSFSIVLLLLILLIFFIYQGPKEFNTYSNLLIQTTYIILSCLALARLTLKKEDDTSILQDPRFCINAMILLFSLVMLITLGSQKYVLQHNIEIRHKVLYFAIMPIANAVLYTGYSLAFILCRMQVSK